MSTHCKVIFGYTDNRGYWTPTKAYYRNSDGYDEAVKPAIIKYITETILGNSNELNTFVEAWNKDAEYRSHELEPLTNIFDYGNCEYQYYIDTSNRGNIKVSILKLDWKFYEKYAVDSYKVIDEFTITL